jgi:HAD superfamily hydrolase (TIGR01549 family)
VSKLKAAIFDLGGTIWEWPPELREEEVLARVTPRAIRMLPSEQATGLTAEAVGTAIRRAYLALEDAACKGDLSPIPGELAVQRGFASLGITVDSETAKAMTAALYVSERETTRMIEGADEALKAIALIGLRMGIISNRMYGGQSLVDDLAHFGISHYFTSMVASGEIGQMKPHPMLFRKALDDLGVSASEAVMIGDDLRADIAGALGVGMRAVWVRRPVTRSDEPPAGVPSIKYLHELAPVIAAMI